MRYSVDLQAEVSVRLYIPRTVLGQINHTVTRIVKSNYLVFEGISHSIAVLLPDIQDFHSFRDLCLVLDDVSRQLIEEHIPHSLYSRVNDRTYDHYLYWITKDLEEIGRKYDVPNRKLTSTVNFYPQSIPAHTVSPKIALTYEDALMEFYANTWEPENKHTQQGGDSSPKLSQGDLREALLAKKLLEN